MLFEVMSIPPARSADAVSAALEAAVEAVEAVCCGGRREDPPPFPCSLNDTTFSPICCNLFASLLTSLSVADEGAIDGKLICPYGAP